MKWTMSENGRSVAIILAAVLIAVLVVTLGLFAAVATVGGDARSSTSADQAVAVANSTELGVLDRSDRNDAAGESEGDGAGAAGVVSTDEELSTDPFERDDSYRWLWADPMAIRMVWANDSGAPYSQLESARRQLEEDGPPVIAIGNGGIFRPGLIPAGLYVEGGTELSPINQNSGEGNFHLHPNGVFAITEAGAMVTTTTAFVARSSPADVPSDIHYAVQSGPMLVVSGEANELFTYQSNSAKIRNAVGISADGRVLLIQSAKPVTMRALADQALKLGATDLLYLDGTLARLEGVTPGKPIGPNIPLATMIAVVDIDAN